MVVLRSGAAVSGAPDGHRALERHDPGLFQIDEAAQIVTAAFQFSCSVARAAPIKRSALPPSCAKPAKTRPTRARDAVVALLLGFGQGGNAYAWTASIWFRNFAAAKL